MPVRKENLEKLGKIVKMMHESISREEFLSAFKQVLDIVSKAEKKNSQAVEALQSTYAKVIHNSERLTKEGIEEVKTQCMQAIHRMIEKSEMEMKDRCQKMEKNHKAMDERVKHLEEQEMPSMEEMEMHIEQNLPKFGEAFRDALELLKDDDRLDKSAIKGLEEEFTKLRESISSIPRGRIGGMRKVPIVKRHRLTDQCNGVTKSFTLPMDTVDVLGVFGTQFPVNYDPYNASGGDWTLSGRTLTLGDAVGAPQTGQTLWVLLETLFY